MQHVLIFKKLQSLSFTTTTQNNYIFDDYGDNDDDNDNGCGGGDGDDDRGAARAARHGAYRHTSGPCKPAIDNCHFQVFPDDTEGAEMSEGGSSNLLTSTVGSLSYSVLAKRWQHRSVGRAASRAPS